MKSYAETAAALLGGALKSSKAVHGGCLSHILYIALEDGREAIVKAGRASATEAAMLRAIAASGAPAPEIYAVADGLLVMGAMRADGNLANAWGAVGYALARLHAAKGTMCGWPEDYAFGSVIIENKQQKSWPAFWAEHRLASSCAHIAAPLAWRVEKLAASVPGRLPELAVPSLLHGDFWGGNILASGNKISALIDPACYYGDGEVDIAMLTVFDSPSPAFYAAYGTLEPGWKERQVIYQLWPALVHLRLFGSAYHAMVDRLLSKAGA